MNCRSIRRNLHTIAVVGPYAERAMTGGGGSSHVVPLYTVDPVAGIEKRVGAKVKVSFADGRDIDEAVSLAKAADVAIVMVGDHETEGHDHPLTLHGESGSIGGGSGGRESAHGGGAQERLGDADAVAGQSAGHSRSLVSGRGRRQRRGRGFVRRRESVRQAADHISEKALAISRPTRRSNIRA